MSKFIDPVTGKTVFLKGDGRKSDKSLESFETPGRIKYDQMVDDLIKTLEYGEKAEKEQQEINKRNKNRFKKNITEQSKDFLKKERQELKRLRKLEKRKARKTQRQAKKHLDQEKQMSEMVIIRGVPGSGKSTLAMTYIEKGFQHFEADQYFIQEDGSYKWKSSDLSNAHQDCYFRTKEAIKAGSNVVISNTFTRIWEMKDYINLAVDNHMELKVIRCVGRFKNIHNVPEDKVDQMIERFELYRGEFIHESK